MSSSPQEPLFRLIAGLGNPGPEYADTRHNAGFMILDQLAARARVTFKSQSRWPAATAATGGIILAKPQSFMNLSGPPLAALARYHKIEPARVLAIFDDVALPLGRIRIRPGGYSGGHNGMASILQHLGDIPRLRIGIGAADGQPMVQHVLGKFLPAERPLLAEAITRAIQAIDCLQTQGIDAAMNQFN